MSVFMKMIDKKLLEMGFVKREESKYIVSYERENSEFGYTQCVDIAHKTSGRHILQSYDKQSTTEYGSNVVGLTYDEARVFMKKMRKMIRRWKKNEHQT